MKYNDYELVSLAQEKNEEAINVLHEKYNKIIYNKSRKVYNLLKDKGLELSDVIQEAMIGFEEAIMGYNQDDSAIFYTFACLCIDRQLKTLIVKQGRDKHKILNEAITLECEDDLNLYNVVSDDVTPETELINKEEENSLHDNIVDILTELECSVFELKIKGFNSKEISDVMNIEIKDVYNAVDRIKNKINKILDK